MKTKERNAMMYKAIKAEYNVNFQKNYFELSCGEIDILDRFADLFRIKPRNGWSHARTLFYRLVEYERKREG